MISGPTNREKRAADSGSLEHEHSARQLAKRESWIGLLRRTLRLSKGRPKKARTRK